MNTIGHNRGKHIKGLSKEDIQSMRRQKADGKSLTELSKIFHCAKSTVSYQCRDLYDYPTRKHTKEEWMAHSREYKRICRENGVTYPSDNVIYKHHSQKRKFYPCTSCGNLIHKNGGICISCYTQKLIANKVAREAYHEKLKQERKIKETTHYKRLDSMIPHSVCSVNISHFYQIDNNNIGICKYCGDKKDYNTISKFRRTNNDR